MDNFKVGQRVYYSMIGKGKIFVIERLYSTEEADWLVGCTLIYEEGNKGNRGWIKNTSLSTVSSVDSFLYYNRKHKVKKVHKGV